MTESLPNPWLNRFALLTAGATLALLGIGGLVTSHGVGLAVPDWPNTYGYNMFLFPFSKWVGGILYEHSHRLMAAFVGMLTTILAGWLWARETKDRERWLGLAAIAGVCLLMGVRALPVYLALAAVALVMVPFSLYRIRYHPGSLRWWGIMAFAAVILQGVLGGLRVVWLKDEIGIFHATLAQVFFALTCAIALLTSRWHRARSNGTTLPTHSSVLRFLLMGATLLILLQLVIGATMRHQHAGLAIPDFPFAYGKIWPAMDPASVAQYNQHRQETVAFNPITAAQIALQMIHRITALFIGASVVLCAWAARRDFGAGHFLTRLAQAWVGLVVIQAILGAATVLTGKAADIATLHVMIGALMLALGTVICLVSRYGLVLVRKMDRLERLTPAPFGPQPSAAIGLK